MEADKEEGGGLCHLRNKVWMFAVVNFALLFLLTSPVSP